MEPPRTPHGRWTRRALAAIAAASVAFSVALAAGDGEVPLFVSDLGLLAASLLAAGACFIRSRRSDAGRPWACAGVGLLGWAGAQAAWTWQQLVTGVPIPGASITDIGFALVLPMAVVAALGIPRATPDGRPAGWLDVVAIGVATLAASWAYVWPSEVTGHAVLALIHPVSFVSAAGLTLYAVARRPQRDGPAFTLAAAGMLFLGLANLVYGRLLVEGAYETGDPMDVAWFAGLLLVAAGAMTPPATDLRVSRRRETLLVASPFVPVALVVAAPILLPPAGGMGLQGRIALLVAVAVVFVRQHKLLLDNRRLASTLEERVAARTAELAESEAKLRLTTSSAEIGTFEWDLATNEVAWSDELRAILDVPAHEPATYQRWLDAVHPDDRAMAEAMSLDDGGTYRVVRRDGSVRHVLSRPGDHTSGGRMVGIMLDVTALREADARVVETLESMGDAYYALDAEWRFTFVNRRAEELLGMERCRLLGEVIWEVFPEIVGSEIGETYLRATVEGRMEQVDAVWFEPHARWYSGRCYPLPDGGVAVYFTDVHDRVAAEIERTRLADALAHQATHDPLTGLANRPALADAVSSVVASQPGRPLHLLFIDVDRFKVVNDSLGHAAGDRLLVAIARRLESFVRPGDVVARIGGDEFVISLVDVDAAGAEQVADRVLGALRVPVEVDGHRLFVTASIGVAAASEGIDVDSLLRDADIALYRAKGAGRDQVAWFDEAARDESIRRLRLEVELRQAIDGDELVLHYQPSYDLRSGLVAGAEALIRWQHPTDGLVPPGAFIPVAEDSGLIGPMGEWALFEAARESRRRLDAGTPLTVWVNVSARQLARPGFSDVVRSCLSTVGLPASLLGVEVTESVLADVASSTAELAALRSFSVRVAIDDFGTGYSSLTRLREFPVDVLKIDRSFVADLATGEDAQAVVAAIVELAHAIGAVTVAEGVETAEQLAVLRAMGCDSACGFHLARPVPASALADAIAGGVALLVAA